MVKYYYVVSEYSATGEGSSIMMLVTRAYPQREDYEEPTNYKNPNLNSSGEFRAVREFINHFGSYYGRGADVLERDEFLEKYKQYVPPLVFKLTDPELKDNPGNFNWSQSIHLNFS